MQLYAGLEIGGSKLQLALGRGDGEVLHQWRTSVDARSGAEHIRARIIAGYRELLAQARLPPEDVVGLGIGFGGPVDVTAGRVLVSHQVDGWADFPLVDWVLNELGLPAVLQNDADTAALAEARFGAGRGFDPALYITVGSGIGGGLIVDGRIYRGGGAGAVEIGHLRPGQLPRHVPLGGVDVESIASGFGIAARARESLRNWRNTLDYVRSQRSPHRTSTDPRFAALMHTSTARGARLWELAGGEINRVTTDLVARAAEAGDPLCVGLLADATHVLGWAVAQAVTLLNPARIVIGGGVSLIGEELFFGPVRRACQESVFAPFANSAEIVPAALGEAVVLQGALALAADAFA